MNTKKRLIKYLASVLLLTLTIFLSGCFRLNQAAIVWITDVKPQFVCPGDNVTLSWNGGNEDGCLGGGCAEVIVSISSDPLGLSSGGLRVRGEQVVGPITGPTSFTFSATGGADPRNPATHDVNVVLPDRETNVPLSFTATCSGSTAVWRDTDLSIPEFRSEGVRLVRVCNPSSQIIRLTLAFESGSRSWTLVPGQCTEDFPPDEGGGVLSAHVASLGLAGPPARCDTSSSLPPDLNLVAALACDLMTTSAPIVAAPEESPTPGLGIIPLPTLTFTPETIPQLTFLTNANCRLGPNTHYNPVGFGQVGEHAQVQGLSDPAGWYYVLLPDGITRCFVSGSTGTVAGSVDDLSVVPAPPLPAAPVLSVSNQTCDSKKYVVRLSWKDVEGEAGYRIYRDSILVASLGADSTFFDDTSPNHGSHGYQVEAFNDFGSTGSTVKVSEGCVY